MERKEMLSMLLDLVNVDDGTVTKDYYNRNELRIFIEELQEEKTNFTLRDHFSRANNGEEFSIHDKTYDSEFCIYSNDGEYYSFEDILLECELVEFWDSGKHITIDLWGAMEKAKERLFKFARDTYKNWSEEWNDTMKFETIFLDLEVVITRGYEELGKTYYNLIFGGETDGKETI